MVKSLDGFKIIHKNQILSLSLLKEGNGQSSADKCIDDDDEAVQSHLRELQKEANKKKMDSNKVTRLLSLTYNFRRHEALSSPASTGPYQCCFATLPMSHETYTCK